MALIDVNELSNWPKYTKIHVGLMARVSAPVMIPLFLKATSGWPSGA